MREAVNVTEVAPPRAHYSHVIRTRPGTGLLWIAGQVPIDENGNVVGADAGEQTEQVLRNLAAVLAASGGNLDDVVKTTTFLVNIADRASVGVVRRRHFGAPPPANSLLVVSSLASPSFLVEIEAVAVDSASQ